MQDFAELQLANFNFGNSYNNVFGKNYSVLNFRFGLDFFQLTTKSKRRT